jgi:hypothetical protein
MSYSVGLAHGLDGVLDDHAFRRDQTSPRLEYSRAFFPLRRPDTQHGFSICLRLSDRRPITRKETYMQYLPIIIVVLRT